MMKFTVSTDLVSILLKYAKLRGIDAELLLSEVGIEKSLIEDRDSRIAISRFIKLWKALVNISGDPDFGLHYGEQSHRLMEKHLLFSVMTSCRTVLQAIQKNFLYHNLLLDSMQPVAIDKGEAFCLTWKSRSPEPQDDRQFSETMLSLFASMLRFLTENQVDFKEIQFRHAKPSSVHEHERIFQTRLSFRQPQNAVIVSRKYLEQPVFLANTELLETLEKMVQQKLHKLYLPQSWSERVVEILQRWLIKKQGKDVDIQSIAREMSMSVRSLQGKLKAEGTSFRLILDEVRKEIAIGYLKDHGISICEIALLLDFSDQSAFNRAFKRWTAFSPRQYRKERLDRSTHANQS